MKLYPYPPQWGPDELCYAAQAQTIRSQGVLRGLRTVAERFLSGRETETPSPLRWLWIVIQGLTVRWGWRTVTLTSWLTLPFVAAWTFQSWWAGLLALTSPLGFLLGRRALQDVTVALVALVALGFALRSEPIPLALTVFALLGLKEASVLYLPALFAAGAMQGIPVETGIALGAATLAWIAATRILVGRETWELFRVVRSAHATEYTRQVQRGGSFRLVVDLVLVSPLVVLVAAKHVDPFLSAFAILVIVAHGQSPIQNVRTIFAVDLVFRAIAAAALPWWGIIVFCAVDVWVARKLRDIYDPTTLALTQALGMTP